MDALNLEHLCKDWRAFPKLRHNLWVTFKDDPDTSYLTVSHSKFKVATSDAELFFQLRSLCTGHNARGDVIQKSGVPLQKAEAILQSLEAAGVFRDPYVPLSDIREAEVRRTLLSATRIWAEQMAETSIAVDVLEGAVPRDVVVGWMLETYHYIRHFPEVISSAARVSTGLLHDVLMAYASQERGHEEFVLRTLERMGMSRDAVMTSVPLVSTRLIVLLMQEMLSGAPASAFLLAAVIEAGELDDGVIQQFMSAVPQRYGFPDDTFAPFFDHARLDEQLGHATLVERHPDLLSFSDEDQVHIVVNQLHDIKHAFDLQKLEIKDYYAHSGNYIPRQFVDYFAI